MTLTRRTLLLSTAGLLTLAAALTVSARPAPVSAHPLGNFTINYYDRLLVSASGIESYSVLDMAEIPALKARQDIDANDDGAVDGSEAEVYAAAKAQELLANLRLIVDGRDVALAETSHEVAFPEGTAGLSLLRLTVTSRAALPEGWQEKSPAVAFANDNDKGKIGWREIVVLAGDGVAVEGDAPAQDTSRALTSYPEGLSSPLDVREVGFAAKSGATVAPPAQAEPTPDPKHARATRGNRDSKLERYANLIAKEDLTFGVVALALLAAAGFGMLHALSPGHGKTIVAAYLVGSRGTARHAALLGLTVTATHTSSVYVLGFVTLYLSEFILPEDLYPWLGVSSGAIILLMGAALFLGRLRASGYTGVALRWLRQRLRAGTSPGTAALSLATADGAALPLAGARLYREPADGSHGHAHDDEHRHEHASDADAHDDRAHEAAGKAQNDSHDEGAHSHGFGLAHSHAIPGQDGEAVTWRRLLGLGVYGGMIPCPSAIVVMLSAASLHRVGFGLVLILAFSIGLAAVLTGIGFVLVFANRYAERVPLLRVLADSGTREHGTVAMLARSIPIVTAAAVMAAGLYVTYRAIGTF